MTDKEQFDKWWKHCFVPEHDYFNDSIHEDGWNAAEKAAWEAWQASRAIKEDDLRPEYDLSKLKPVIWEQELMYKHRGERIPRFINLGQCIGTTRHVAIERGNELAEKWLAEKFKPDEIESWEVKARRAKTV